MREVGLPQKKKAIDTSFLTMMGLGAGAVATDVISPDTQIFDKILGPYGALVGAILIIWWLAKGISAIFKWVADRADKWGEALLKQISSITAQNAELIEEGKKDRAVYEENSEKDRGLHRESMGELISEIKVQHDHHSEKLDEHSEKLEDHSEKLSEILIKIDSNNQHEVQA